MKLNLRKFFDKPEVQEMLEELANADDEPSPWLQTLNLAYECERKFDWEGAEKAYILACEVEESAGLRAMGYKKLSGFYALMGRNEEAYEAASKAVEVSEELSLSIMLYGKAWLCVALDKIDEAEQLTTQLLTIVTDREFNLLHYNALLLRAQVAVKQGRLADAQADLDDVWESIATGDNSFMMGGFQVAIGDWWSISAQIHAANGDSTAAIAALREEVKRWRIMAQLGHVEGIGKHNNLACALWRLGKQLEAANDSGAKYAFIESRSIRESIGLSGDFS